MIEIVNLTKKKIPASFLNKVKTISRKILISEKAKNKDVVLTIVSLRNMKDINNKYRNKNKATDVLSFEMNEDGILGDIIICPDYVKKGTIRKMQNQLLELMIHGVLHLIGFDHANDKQRDEMFKLQAQYLEGAI